METLHAEYNESRPHRALGERAPHELANEIAASRDFIGLQSAENSPEAWSKKARPSRCENPRIRPGRNLGADEVDS